MHRRTPPRSRRSGPKLTVSTPPRHPAAPGRGDHRGPTSPDAAVRRFVRGPRRSAVQTLGRRRVEVTSLRTRLCRQSGRAGRCSEHVSFNRPDAGAAERRPLRISASHASCDRSICCFDTLGASAVDHRAPTSGRLSFPPFPPFPPPSIEETAHSYAVGRPAGRPLVSQQKRPKAACGRRSLLSIPLPLYDIEPQGCWRPRAATRQAIRRLKLFRPFSPDGRREQA